ncbi:MAG: hypothetical protein QNJ12_02515 [Ilumatobacter sp.]|uniref:hypothetical protein n=1 Tax=Ilumatobacter sp. TaxID=1967498 RepID=UPI00261033CA|nr:hypothetical protein [Ilumatobacter sp.]MDJ0767631.1 hypothetical protein [Ilumatobacter sp.]
MTRQRLQLQDADLALLADVLEADAAVLRTDLERRPWHACDVLRNPGVVAAVLHDDGERLVVSPALFFAILVHHAADQLATSTWVDDWVGPGQRLPVFDVEPLLEFADAPGRLLFAARLLVGFAAPPDLPVPVDAGDLDEMVDWLDAVEPADRVVLLRQLGDLALFRAGVFPDRNGPCAMSVAQAEHLGGSVGLSDDELDHLVDHLSASPGLDALEMLSSAWYRAAAEHSATTPPLLRDVANRIRAARRFLNYVADNHLHPTPRTWALGV